MNVIIVNKADVESGIVKIIDELNMVMDRINSTSAYKKEECEERLKLFEKRETLENALRLMGLQAFQYRRGDRSVYISIT